MSYKIAVATSDNQLVDLHFGAADKFQIYSVEGVDFQFLEERRVNIVGNQNLAVGSANYANGCGERKQSGCGGGEKSAAVELLSDCRAIVAAKIGRNVLKQFEAKAISTFDVEVSVNDALTKIVNYYYKIDNRKWKIGN